MRALIAVLVVVVFTVGCASEHTTESNERVSLGDLKMTEGDEMEEVKDITGNDYQEMTQTDSKLQIEAMASYDKAIEADPTNAQAYYDRGFALLRHSNEARRAIRDFDQAIELSPEFAQAYLMRSRAYEAIGALDKAAADHQKALALEPGID